MSGSLLASDPQLLTYYALPYVRNPQSHPSFRHIFTPGFASDLRQQLSTALQTVPAELPLPRLYTMYAQAAHVQASGGAHPSGAVQLTPLGSRQHPFTVDTANSSLVGVQQALSRPVSSQQGIKGASVNGPVSGQQGINGMSFAKGASQGAPKGDSRPTSAVPIGSQKGDSRPVSAVLNGDRRGSVQPTSVLLNGSQKGDSRPISALLNGSKELADLVSASKPRYADQLQVPSLEPSAEILQGECGSLRERAAAAAVLLLHCCSDQAHRCCCCCCCCCFQQFVRLTRLTSTSVSNMHIIEPCLASCCC